MKIPRYPKLHSIPSMSIDFQLDSNVQYTAMSFIKSQLYFSDDELYEAFQKQGHRVPKRLLTQDDCV